MGFFGVSWWLFSAGLKLNKQPGGFGNEPQGKQICPMQVRVVLFSGKYLIGTWILQHSGAWILQNHQLLLPVLTCLWDRVTSTFTAQGQSSLLSSVLS